MPFVFLVWGWGYVYCMCFCVIVCCIQLTSLLQSTGISLLLFLPPYGSVHEILVLIIYAQKPPINAHACASIEARSQNFDMSRHLSLYIVYACSEVSGLDMITTKILCAGIYVYIYIFFSFLDRVSEIRQPEYIPSEQVRSSLSRLKVSSAFYTSCIY